MKDNFHTPVLRTEVIAGLQIRDGKRYIDATVGAGGHASEIVRQGGILLGIDTDGEAIERARATLQANFPLKVEGVDWKLIQGNFGLIEDIARGSNFDRVEGVLLDLGVSSYQLDTPARGFSYRFTNEKLDLRLDQTKGETAATCVNTLSEENLYDIFATYGEEQLARSIARAIVISRRVKRIETTGDLVELVTQVTGNSSLKAAVLSRIFQALRIYVNDELTMLRNGLVGSRNILAVGGILEVISFHSLEDRIVKQFFEESGWNNLTKKPIVPSYKEIRINKRARSAKLRVGQKL